MRWWYYDYVSLISIIFHYCCFLIAKSCLTCCNAMDSSHQAPLSMGFPQTRLEWVAISFPKEPLQPRDWTQVSYTAGWFLTTGPLRKPMYHWKLKHYLLFTLTCSIMFNCTDCSLSSSSLLGIFQARIWSWLPFPPPGDFPDQRSNPCLPSLLHCRHILYHLSHQGRLKLSLYS